MKKIVILGCLLIIYSCGNKNQGATDSDMSAKFSTLLEGYYKGGLSLQPILATAQGIEGYNHLFPDVLSDAYTAQSKTFYKNYLDSLTQIDDNKLSETEKLTKKVLHWDCTVKLEQLDFENYMPINQMWSLNLFFGQLASGSSAQPFKTTKDYYNWLERLDGYALWLQSAEDKMKKGIEVGQVLPKSLIKKVIPQIESMTGKNVKEHLFYQPIVNIPGTFSDEEKEKLASLYEKKIETKIIPAYESLFEFLKNKYLDAGRTTSGISALDRGSEYYNYAIKEFTTTTLTADEIHNIGLKEVSRILKEMEGVKEKVGFKGSIKEFFGHVRVNKNLMPFKTAGEVVANFDKIHETMKPQLEKLFDLTPKTPFEVRRTEAFREKAASAEYNPGSLDGTRPGIFYVPVPDAAKYNSYTDEALFLHEAIPGHHYQISLGQENTNLPEFRKSLWYSAFGEGWALYCESLGQELGLYTDPYQYFGMLSMEMHRAIRLVVDTGMHAKGWTREQAIQYSLDNEAESEASIISEIERYMANPGQALSYKIGQIKIRELRQKAETELGDAFNIKAFHNQLLETGCIPLKLLEEKIDNWIDSVKTPKANTA